MNNYDYADMLHSCMYFTQAFMKYNHVFAIIHCQSYYISSLSVIVCAKPKISKIVFKDKLHYHHFITAILFDCIFDSNI